MIKNFILLSGGAFLAQIINFLILLYLARTIETEDYGVYSIAVTIVGYFSVLLSAKYHHAILASNDGDVIQLISSAIVCSFVLAFFMFVLALILADFFPSNIRLDNQAIIIVSAYFSSLYLFFYYYSLKLNENAFIFKSRLLGPLAGGVATVLLISFFPTGTSALIGYMVAIIVSTMLLLRREFFDFQWQKSKKVLKKYIAYPMYLMPSGLVEIFNSSYLMLASAGLYGLKAAAAVGVFQRFIMSPQGIVVNVIGDMFRKKICDESKKNEVYFTFCYVFLGLLFIALLSSTILYVIVEIFMVPVLGESWKYAVESVLALIPVFFVSFFVIPLSYVLYNGSGKKYDLIIQVVTAFILIVLYLFAQKFDFIEFLYLYVIIMCLKYIAELAVSWVLIRRSHEKT